MRNMIELKLGKNENVHLPTSYRGTFNEDDKQLTLHSLAIFIRYHELTDIEGLNDELAKIGTEKIPVSWHKWVTPMLKKQEEANKQSIYSIMTNKEKKEGKAMDNTKSEIQEIKDQISMLAGIVSEYIIAGKSNATVSSPSPTAKSNSAVSIPEKTKPDAPKLPKMSATFAHVIFSYITGYNQYKSDVWMLTGIRNQEKSAVVIKSLPDAIMKLAGIRESFESLHAHIETETTHKRKRTFTNHTISIPVSSWYAACEQMNDDFGTEFYIPEDEGDE